MKFTNEMRESMRIRMEITAILLNLSHKNITISKAVDELEELVK